MGCLCSGRRLQERLQKDFLAVTRELGGTRAGTGALVKELRLSAAWWFHGSVAVKVSCRALMDVQLCGWLPSQALFIQPVPEHTGQTFPHTLKC